jgi:anti-sigma-K factor RskA
MNREDASALAAEYVLGLLDDDALAQAETLRQSDADFSAAIMMWEMRLMPIAEAVPLVTPPARLWDRINAATQPSPPHASKKLGWRGVFIGAGFAAACMAVFFWRGHTPETRELASLASTGGGTFIVSETAEKTMIVDAKDITLPAGKTAELWMILPGHAPLAAGLLADGQRLSASVPAGVSNVVLAVSLEPAGGSPTGGPTGPIIAEGKITNL